MTLDEIRWMTELFRTQNMSKAAETLFVSQPALSQCVKRIEAQLGFPLFERSNKGLVPTEKGLLFSRAAQDITGCYQQFLGQVKLLDHSQLRQIAIGMAPYLSACCSADVLRQLQIACPQIQFSVYEADLDNLLEALRENTIQLVITSGPLNIRGLKEHPIGAGELMIFLRKGSPAAQYAYEEDGVRYLDPRHLAKEPLALTKPKQASRRLSEKLLREAGVEPVAQQESQHISTLYRYVQKGIASSIAPIVGDLAEQDRENRLIYKIPNTYRHKVTYTCILVQPEIDRMMPEEIYDIIQRVVQENEEYIKRT